MEQVNDLLSDVDKNYRKIREYSKFTIERETDLDTQLKKAYELRKLSTHDRRMLSIFRKFDHLTSQIYVVADVRIREAAKDYRPENEDIRQKSRIAHTLGRYREIHDGVCNVLNDIKSLTEHLSNNRDHALALLERSNED
jgi:hypothetical protein